MIEVTMEIYRNVKRQFMQEFDRYEPVILDHTATIAAKQCLRKYFYQIVLGRVPKEDAIYFAWGSAYHTYREWLSRSYGVGDDTPKVFDEKKAMEAHTIAVNKGLDYWKSRGRDQDTESKFSWMTAARLLMSFNKAFMHWMAERKNGKIIVIATEQPFNIQLPDGSWRSGTADEIVRWNGQVWGRDFKTTSKDTAFYQRNLSPNEQFTGYTYSEGKLAGTDCQGQIVELLYNSKTLKSKGEQGPEIVSLIASRTKWQLEQWEQDTMFWKKVIDMSREADIYPMTEVSCSFCPYHQVCTSNNEAAMMNQLKSEYVVRPWDNTKIRD